MRSADHPQDDAHTLAVVVRQVDGHSVVTLDGEVDIFSVNHVRAALDDVLIDGASMVIVDLSAVHFMDSSGLGALVRARKKARVLRTEFAVVCADGMVRQLFAMTGMVHVFPIFDSLEAAVHEGAPLRVDAAG